MKATYRLQLTPDFGFAAAQQLVPYLSAAPRISARLRLVFLSGDWIPVALPDRIRQAFPRARVVALGGATEATIWSNSYPVREVPPEWRRWVSRAWRSALRCSQVPPRSRRPTPR